MTSDVLTVHENDCIEQAAQVMAWHGFHHLPVENERGELVGLLTDGLLQRYQDSTEQRQYVQELMLTDVTTVEPQDSIQTLVDTLQQKQLSGVPVMYAGRLVGMITTNDTERLLTRSKQT
jgi:predicted transcriptional regulator